MRLDDDSGTLASMLLEASPDGLLLVGADGVVRLANRRALEMFGVDDLVDTSVDALVPRELRDDHADMRRRYVGHPQRRPMGSDLRLLAQRVDGTRFPVEISLSPVTIDDELLTIAAVRDQSERQATMAKVALMKDRERIARDIHDMVIQRIFGAGMQLQAVFGHVESDVIKDRLTQVTDELDETIRQLRHAIFQLGTDDAHQTLSAHLAAVAEERSHHLGFLPDLSVSGDLDALPDYLGDQLVATLTEALSNVARHANATRASIRIVSSDGTVELDVRDNGSGIQGTPKANGGLSNMMWRAAELGGSCSVEANLPSGTALVWHVPVTTR
ncbi:MAG: PAS domain-containing sensor histidine kinase [Ilumatobacter sp.]